jgi:hypothetical protein
MTTARSFTLAIRSAVLALLLSSAGCAATKYALPTQAEKADFQSATDGNLATAAALPLTNDAIYPFLEQFLAAHPEVYGSTLSLDPAYAGKQLAPYVYRSGGTLVRKDLAVGGYDYAKAPWFTEPMTRKAPVWSDAYFDEGGGEIMMVTYSAPVMKDGRVIGVLTADFALEEE